MCCQQPARCFPRHFSSFLTGVVRQEDLVGEGEVGQEERIRMEMLRDTSRACEDNPNLHEAGPDKMGAAALLLMVDKGLITREEIMDGSFFHDCARELRYPSGGPEIQETRNTGTPFLRREAGTPSTGKGCRRTGVAWPQRLTHSLAPERGRPL